jgi:hypothetical protein
MLYVGCSVCRNVTYLVCAGQLFPHVPVPITRTPMGISCNFCGPLPLFFTCTICWTRQALYLPGLNPMQIKPMLNQTQYIAPVVQANPGLGQPEMNRKFSDVAKDILKIGIEVAVQQSVKAWLK